MLEYAFEHNTNNRLFDSVTINTNGVLLTKSSSKRLLRLATLTNQHPSTLRRLHFSVDAIKPETFEAMKGKRLLNRVTENILTFLELRQRQGTVYPNVTLALVVCEQNKDEAGEFLKHWLGVLKRYRTEVEVTHDWPRTRLDTVYIRRLDDWQNQESAERLHKRVVEQLGIVAHTEGRIIRTNSVLGFEASQPRRPCPGPWRTPIIHRNGDVSVCCFDIRMENKIGNVNETPLHELWDSELINRWRVAHIKGEFDKAAPLCSKCGNLFGPVLTDGMVLGWLRETGRRDLISVYKRRLSQSF